MNKKLKFLIGGLTSIIGLLIIMLVLSSCGGSSSNSEQPGPAGELPSIFEGHRPLPVSKTEIERMKNESRPEPRRAPVGYAILEGQIRSNQGTVMNNYGHSGATVSIDELKLSVITDEDGRFEFPPIYVGTEEHVIRYGERRVESFNKRVDVKVTAIGYQEYVKHDLDLGSTEVYGLTLILEKIGTPQLPSLSPKQKIGDSQEKPSFSKSSSEIIYSSQNAAPPYIRVAICGDGPACGQYADSNRTISYREIVPFEFYLKHVLPGEWFNGWHPEAYKAGALAVKNFAWFWVNQGGKSYTVNADVDSSVNYQMYDRDTVRLNTDKAINDTAIQGWYQNGQIFQPSFAAGISGQPGPENGNQMKQWGSQFLALQGKLYQEILNWYYDPDPSYFNLSLNPPSLSVTRINDNSNNLEFSSFGATKYQIDKYRFDASTNRFVDYSTIYSGSDTSFLDIVVIL